MANDSLKISVITPSFNQSRFLEATIRSVLSQDYPNFEYLVLDGNSSDGSIEIIRKYSSKLAYWHSVRDRGQADAIATGFEICTGDILCWLNSDDIFLPGALSAVARYFENNPQKNALSGGAFLIDAEGRILRQGFGYFTLGVPVSYNRLRFYGQDGVYQPSTFWRRSVYKTVGGIDKNLRFIMDRDLFARIARHGDFGRLPQFLACFRLHETAKTSTIPHVREIESNVFNQTHRCSTPGILNIAFFLYYRIESLLRKSWLRGLEAAGFIPLESTSFINFLNGLHDANAGGDSIQKR